MKTLSIVTHIVTFLPGLRDKFKIDHHRHIDISHVGRFRIDTP